MKYAIEVECSAEATVTVDIEADSPEAAMAQLDKWGPDHFDHDDMSGLLDVIDYRWYANGEPTALDETRTSPEQNEQTKNDALDRAEPTGPGNGGAL